MQWDEDARQKLAEVPALLKSFVAKKVEEVAKRQGADRVSLSIWEAAKKLRSGGGKPGYGSPAPTSGSPADEALPAPEVLAALVQEAESKGRREGNDFRLRVCGGAFGCPRPQVEVAQLAKDLEAELGRSGHAERLAAALGDRILTHHKLAIGVSGCVNGCSEPQTKDFGVLGVAKPGAVAGQCSGCRKCERACQEGAVKAGGPSAASPDPSFDQAACIGCGDCARACPNAAISLSPGYKVVVGGRLGRHPRLAETLLPFTSDPAEVTAALRTVLDWAAEVGAPGERLGALIERFGIETLRERLAASQSRSEPRT